ncbi:hypothetical protein RGQ29_016505 [Quercus rubra]|uniref:Wax synthase domain-containing protein n=1 Tax=Quercus rubra TaxID=3512 RepID=A0AAN7IZ97_QUERU|nr:hypothetical protein RGQ29_016505 [Quercus rubra]
MEGEINNFIKVWLSILVCLSYCYAISKIVSKGLSRLLYVLPIVCLFIFLPLDLHSIHLRSTPAFFIVWLANFKLLLFAFGRGPLYGHNKENLPPKPIEKPKNPPMPHLNGQNKENPTSKKTQERHISPLNYAIKGILFSILTRLYDYSDYMHPKVIMLLYFLHTYFLLEFILAIATTLARALLGIELEPQFNEPYLTSSLHDFWGGRWNLMVTWFFLLHGLCLVVEVVMKEVVLAGRFQLPWLISGPLTIGFVIITSFWLFFPPFLQFKDDEKAFEEYVALGEFLKNVILTFIRVHT